MPRAPQTSWKIGRLTLRLLDGTARRGRWRVEWYPEGGQGKQRTRSLGWLSRVQAERTAAALLAGGLLDERPQATTAGEIRTVRDVLEIYNGALHARGDLRASTRGAYEGCLARLQRHVGELPVALLGRSVATTYRDRYLAHTGGSGTQTIHTDLSLLGSAVRYLQDRGLQIRSPARLRLQIRRTYSDRTPSPAEVEAVLAQLSTPWHRAALCLLWGTGARIGDLALLTWADVSPTAITISEESKTGRRVIPLTARAIEGLAILREHHPGTAASSVWPARRSFRQTLYNALHRGAKLAGVEAFSCHALRRLAVNELRQAGVELEVVAAITGHSVQTLLRYYRRVNPLEVTAALARNPLGEVPAGTILTAHPYWKGIDEG